MTETNEQEFLRSQRVALESEKTQLQEQLARIARKDPVGDDYHARVEQIGRAEDENALEEQEYEAARSTEQQFELQLRDVTTALQQIADGTYGICTACRAHVERKRLKALPSATTCLAHAVQGK